MRLPHPEEGFFKNLLTLAVPMMLQSLVSFLVGFADNLMVGTLGEIAISGVYLGNQPQTLLQNIIIGVDSAMLILSAQYWGRRDTDSIKKLFVIALRIALSLAVVFTAATIIAPRPILHLFIQDEVVIEEGMRYLSYVRWSYMIFAASQLLITSMRSVETVKVGMYSSFISLGVNVVLNYILIFGKLGFPALGIVGAAIATLISRIVELLMVLFYVIFMEKQIRLSLRKMLRIRGVLVRDLFRYSLPTICSETLWGLGISCHAAIIGNMGEVAYAAYSVANIIERIGQLATMGFANAALVIIGKEIGAGREHNAYPYAKTLLALATLLGALMSGVVVLLARPAVSLFNVVDATKDTAVNIIFVIAVMVFIKSFNATAIVGVFRGGGDTVTAMLMDSVCMWTISVPMGLLAAYVLELPVWWVYAFLMSDEVVKIFIGFWRVASRKWIRNVTR